MGFDLTDKKLKRAGLDYWDHLQWSVHENIEDFLARFKDRPKFFFSRFATQTYWDASYPEDAMLIFGSETQGLPEGCKEQYPNQFYVIPSPGQVRSLNLSTSAGIVLFEALRQNTSGPS